MTQESYNETQPQFKDYHDFYRFFNPYLQMYGKKDFVRSTIELYYKKLKSFTKHIVEEAMEEWGTGQKSKNYKRFPDNMELFFNCVRLEKLNKFHKERMGFQKYCGYCGKLLNIVDEVRCSKCKNDYIHFKKRDQPTCETDMKRILREKIEIVEIEYEEGKKEGKWQTHREFFFKKHGEKYRGIRNGSAFKV